ncbi:MAG TPA: hypothetical protein PLA54_05155 [Spirochaetota bacterium]|nr:hypothetical protein [Spirochaetota bacterium]HQE58567.1 hypothetical protein [Spirochaetota bacterium]
MLKKRIKIVILLCLFTAFSFTELSAFGIGSFIARSSAAGSTDKEEQSDPILGPDNDLSKHEHSSYKKLRFGLLMDSDPNPDSLSFRLITGFGLGEVEKRKKRTEHLPDGSDEVTHSNKTYNVLEYFNVTGCGYISIIKSGGFNFCIGPQFTASYSTEKKVSYSDFCFGLGISASTRYFITDRVYCTADLDLNGLYSVNGDIDLLYGEVTVLFGLALKI